MSKTEKNEMNPYVKVLLEVAVPFLTALLSKYLLDDPCLALIVIFIAFAVIFSGTFLYTLIRVKLLDAETKFKLVAFLIGAFICIALIPLCYYKCYCPCADNLAVDLKACKNKLKASRDSIEIEQEDFRELLDQKQKDIDALNKRIKVLEEKEKDYRGLLASCKRDLAIEREKNGSAQRIRLEECESELERCKNKLNECGKRDDPVPEGTTLIIHCDDNTRLKISQTVSKLQNAGIKVEFNPLHDAQKANSIEFNCENSETAIARKILNISGNGHYRIVPGRPKGSSQEYHLFLPRL